MKCGTAVLRRFAEGQIWRLIRGNAGIEKSFLVYLVGQGTGTILTGLISNAFVNSIDCLHKHRLSLIRTSRSSDKLEQLRGCFL